MESFRAYAVRHITGLRVALVLLAVVLGGAIGLAGGLAGVGAESNSAYSDPKKPVLSYILSDQRNVEEFQKEFGLSDEQVQEVLDAVQKENTVLSGEYEESEQIVDSSEGASEEQIKGKIQDSDFDEKLKEAVAQTKSDVEDILPDDRAGDLESWVNGQWRQETAEYSTESEPTYQVSSRGYACSVWATYYDGYTRNEVALPHKKVKFDGGHRVRIIAVGKGTRTRAPVKEVGPWNVTDNYWQARRYRDRWKNLPRCVPEAEAAFYDNYHKGEDQFGREVLNPSGFDMTLRVARRLHVSHKIKREGKIKVRVYYPWVRR
ncbi:MAG TPA: hypothetical protein VFI90_02825 [Rubrobacter sp.]|nr:hypothetical protein [Rubrobacter sp.]